VEMEEGGEKETENIAVHGTSVELYLSCSRIKE